MTTNTNPMQILQFVKKQSYFERKQQNCPGNKKNRTHRSYSLK